LAVLLAAQSTTALLAALAGAAVLACAWLARRGPVAAPVVTAAALGAAIIIAAALLAAPDALAALVGRDLTFTGRTEIWRYSLDALAERPFLGHGLEAFWADPDGPAYGVRRAIGWDAPSAHNGWIDLALTLGALGVALFALNFAATLARALPALSQAGPKRFAPAMLAAFFVFTLSESVILTSGALAWALYMAVSARLALDRRQP
jgi:O-antigen ligase